MAGAGSAHGVWAFSMLGGVQAWRAGDELDLGPPQQQAVLATLLLRPGKAVPADEIMQAVWGFAEPASARGSLYTYIHRLRRVLATDEDSLILSRSHGYALAVAQDTVDISRFWQAVRDASLARGQGDTVATARLLEAALDFWRGMPFPDLAGEYFAAERTRLVGAWLTALEELAEIEVDHDKISDAMTRLATVTRTEPLRERAYELMMLAHVRQSRQAEALATYEKIRCLLRDELGVYPGVGLRELHQRVLEADPSLVPAGMVVEPAAVKPPKPAQLPPDLAVFAGRQNELASVSANLSSVNVIHGMAGVGKTTFAVRLGHQLADRFPDGQLYLDLRGYRAGNAPMSPAEALNELLGALGIRADRGVTDVGARAALYRSVLAERSFLIVLDNARDSDQVLPLLPGTSRSLVVVTSRNRLDGLVASTGARTVELDVLTPSEAEELLRLRVSDRRADAEPEATRKIVELCTQLPLALAVTAARAACRPATPLSAIAAELSRTQGSLDAFSTADKTVDVRAVVSWSYQALTVPAARVFRLLAVHPGTTLSLSSIASLAGIPVPAAAGLLEELSCAHLVTEQGLDRFALHDLIRVFAAEMAEQVGDEVREPFGRLLEHFRHTAFAAARVVSKHHNLPDLPACPSDVTCAETAGRQEASEWFAHEHGALIAMVHRAAEQGFPVPVWQIVWAMRHFLDRYGHWESVEPLYEIALQAADQAQDEIGVAYARRGLARSRGYTLAPESANEQLSQAIEAYAKAGDTLSEAYTWRQRARTLALGRQYSQALAASMTSLELFRHIQFRPGIAAALNTVGYYELLAGRPEAATRYAREALDLHEQEDEPYSQAEALHILGWGHVLLGAGELGIEVLSRSLAQLRDLGIPSDIAGATLTLSMALDELGMTAEAQRFRAQYTDLRESLTPDQRRWAEWAYTFQGAGILRAVTSA